METRLPPYVAKTEFDQQGNDGQIHEMLNSKYSKFAEDVDED